MSLDLRADPWSVNRRDYPSGGSNSDKLRFLLNYAVLAPSSHNTQPWLFKLTEDEVWLYADRVRELPVVDPEHRELIISCGAALFNLRSAIRYFGHREIIEILPDSRNASLIASIRLGDRYQPSDSEKLLFSAITRRRTNRKRYFDRPIPQTLIQECENAAFEEGARLHLVPETIKSVAGDLVAEADVVQWSNSEYRSELAEWVTSKRSSRDGIPGYALGFGLAARFAPSIIRFFNLGKSQGRKNRRLVDQSSMIVVIETDADSPDDWVAAGQALERVILRARADDVWASYFNQVVEVPAIRNMLKTVLGVEGVPQLLLRMGYGPEVKHTPRRPLVEVIR